MTEGLTLCFPPSAHHHQGNTENQKGGSSNDFSAPHWPRRPLFPDLVNMSVDLLLFLNSRPNLSQSPVLWQNPFLSYLSWQVCCSPCFPGLQPCWPFICRWLLNLVAYSSSVWPKSTFLSYLHCNNLVSCFGRLTCQSFLWPSCLPCFPSPVKLKGCSKRYVPVFSVLNISPTSFNS